MTAAQGLNPFEFRAGIHSRWLASEVMKFLSLNPFEFRAGIHSYAIGQTYEHKS